MSKVGLTSGLGLLASTYGDDSDEGEVSSGAAAYSTAVVVNTAPSIMDNAPDSHVGAMWNALKEDKAKKQHVLYQNPAYEEMWAAQQGPTMSVAEQRQAGIQSKAQFVGQAEAYHPVSDFAFEEQYHTFNAFGFAANPSANGGGAQSHGAGPSVSAVVGDLEKWTEARGESVFSSRQPLESRMDEQRKRLRLDESYAQIPHAQPELTPEQAAAIAARQKEAKKAREGRGEEDAPTAMEETSIFHGKNLKDYQGRSWLHPGEKEHNRDEEHECYIPKKWCVCRTHSRGTHDRHVCLFMCRIYIGRAATPSPLCSSAATMRCAVSYLACRLASLVLQLSLV